jgi:hypothetical protein
MRCKAKGLECNYDGEKRKDSALQLPGLGINEAESRSDVLVDHAASTTELGAFPDQTWLISLPNSGHEEHFQVDFRPNNLTSQDHLLGSQFDHEMNFDWNVPVHQYESRDSCSNPNTLDRIAEDMCNSARQLTVSSYPEGSSQVIGHLENEPR